MITLTFTSFSLIYTNSNTVIREIVYAIIIKYPAFCKIDSTKDVNKAMFYKVIKRLAAVKSLNLTTRSRRGHNRTHLQYTYSTPATLSQAVLFFHEQ